MSDVICTGQLAVWGVDEKTQKVVKSSVPCENIMESVMSEGGQQIGWLCKHGHARPMSTEIKTACKKCGARNGHCTGCPKSCKPSVPSVATSTQGGSAAQVAAQAIQSNSPQNPSPANTSGSTLKPGNTQTKRSKPSKKKQQTKSASQTTMGSVGDTAPTPAKVKMS